MRGSCLSVFSSAVLVLAFVSVGRAAEAPRLRVIIETDAGGDPDDEQSMVRFLLCCNEWDLEGIIANRPEAREKENLNRERTGLGIVRALVKAYGECQPRLKQHDGRYPDVDFVLRRTVAGYNEVDDGVKLIMAAVDSPDPRPVWFCDWGTDHGAAVSNLRRALDRVLRERGPAGYAKFKSRLRLSSADAFGPHTNSISPPFPIWVDTFRPEIEKKRWYWQFSAITARAGGFDLERDVRTGHGRLGALYPTNTTHRQKEGDTMSFLYLVPTGMNDPEQPTWGSWAGRYGLNETLSGKPYYWANQVDSSQGVSSRDQTLARWAVDLQNDFRARLDWCVKDFAHANHPPAPRVRGEMVRSVKSGESVELDAGKSSDPDGDALRLEWICYPEAGTYRGRPPEIRDAGSGRMSFVAPKVESAQTIHFILIATDSGSPPLARYRRVIVTVTP